MEFFFNWLEKYIDVRPSTAMTDIIVKIMVEVLSILGIATKEVRQGRTSMSLPIDLSSNVDLRTERYLKKLVGRMDVENGLQRLDKLTQEEARIAAVEVLMITRGIEDKVQGVDHKVKETGVVIQQVASLVSRLNRS